MTKNQSLLKVVKTRSLIIVHTAIQEEFQSMFLHKSPINQHTIRCHLCLQGRKTYFYEMTMPLVNLQKYTAVFKIEWNFMSCMCTVQGRATFCLSVIIYSTIKWMNYYPVKDFLDFLEYKYHNSPFQEFSLIYSHLSGT